MAPDPEVDPRRLHGLHPDSPYADLFVQIFHLTKPPGATVVSKEAAKREDLITNSTPPGAKSRSEPPTVEEMEEGEIGSEEEVAAMQAEGPGPHKRRALLPCPAPAPAPMAMVKAPAPRPSLLLPLAAQFSLDTGPARTAWLRRLQAFMAGRGTPLLSSPSRPELLTTGPDTPKRPLDLHRLFEAVREEGGGNACSANQGWRSVAYKMDVPVQKFFVLKKMYERYLQQFEDAEVREMQESVMQGLGAGVVGSTGAGPAGLRGGKAGPGKGSVLDRLGRGGKRGKRGGGWRGQGHYRGRGRGGPGGSGH
jgi:hypothetical protein